jgi:hypothetical protein
MGVEVGLAGYQKAPVDVEDRVQSEPGPGGLVIAGDQLEGVDGHAAGQVNYGLMRKGGARAGSKGNHATVRRGQVLNA